MISFSAYVIWREESLQVHILVVCYALLTAVYVTFQLTRTMIAGVCVNFQLRRRISAMNEIVYRQRLMEAHPGVPRPTEAHDIQEFKSTMLFAEAVLQRLVRKRGWARLLCFRLEAYSLIPGLISGWGLLMKLTQGFHDEQEHLD